MKIYSTLILLVWTFSINAFANEHILCKDNGLELKIIVMELAGEKSVLWSLKHEEIETPTFTGIGKWLKEVESEDAFSSYDDTTAVAFKNNRAAFVFPDNTAMIFNICEILEN